MKCPNKKCKYNEPDGFENCRKGGIQIDGHICSDYNKYIRKLFNKNKIKLVPYEDLALGTRFKYVINGERSITWIKLSHDGLIAEFNKDNMANKWLGQTIASHESNEQQIIFVEVME